MVSPGSTTSQSMTEKPFYACDQDEPFPDDETALSM
jgi:hypothetical protein